VTTAAAHVAATAAAHVAATATALATTATAATRERGCRWHGAAEGESDCKNHHNLTQHHILNTFRPPCFARYLEGVSADAAGTITHVS
jgi:hypothetical protein